MATPKYFTIKHSTLAAPGGGDALTYFLSLRAKDIAVTTPVGPDGTPDGPFLIFPSERTAPLQALDVMAPVSQNPRTPDAYVIHAKNQEGEDRYFLVDKTNARWLHAQKIPTIRPLPDATPLVCKDGTVVILTPTITATRKMIKANGDVTSVVVGKEVYLFWHAWRVQEQANPFRGKYPFPTHADKCRTARRLNAPKFTDLTELTAPIVENRQVLTRWELGHVPFVHVLAQGLGMNCPVFILGVPVGTCGLHVVWRLLDMECVSQIFDQVS